jgi:hypothetical protein
MIEGGTAKPFVVSHCVMPVVPDARMVTAWYGPIADCATTSTLSSPVKVGFVVDDESSVVVLPPTLGALSLDGA